MKTITICGEEYDIECNGLTYANYRKFFNTGIFDDLKILKTFLAKQVIAVEQLKEENPDIEDEAIIGALSSLMMEDMDLFVLAATRMAYIMIYTANKKVEEYDKWLEGITSLKTNDEWIAEVTEYAVNCFC